MVAGVEAVKRQMREMGLWAFVGLSTSVSRPTGHSSRPRNTYQCLPQRVAMILPQAWLCLCRG